MRLERIAQGLFLLLVLLLAVGLFWPIAQLALTLLKRPHLRISSLPITREASSTLC